MVLRNFAKGALEECAISHHILVRSMWNVLSCLLYYTKSITDSHGVVVVNIRDIVKSIASKPLVTMHPNITQYHIHDLPVI